MLCWNLADNTSRGRPVWLTPSPTLMGSLLFAAEAGRDAYHDAVMDAESGAHPLRGGRRAAGRNGCLVLTGQWIGSLGLFLVVLLERLF